MPVTFGVISASTRAGSSVIVTGSMSQNTGVAPLQLIACGVAGKVNGVVITSPRMPNARTAASSAIVPLLNSDTSGTSR